MRAGLLREKITFLAPVDVITPSGFKRKEFTPVLETKAARRKISLASGGTLNAVEEFTGQTIVFQVRRNPKVKDNQRILYQNATYEIKLIDPQTSDNTLIITCTKLND